MSDNSRAIWLLRFFVLSSSSRRLDGVENDDRLWRDVRSSMEPKNEWKVFSAMLEEASLLCAFHVAKHTSELTVDIIVFIVVVVFIVAELFRCRTSADSRHNGTGASRLNGLLSQRCSSAIKKEFSMDVFGK